MLFDIIAMSFMVKTWRPGYERRMFWLGGVSFWRIYSGYSWWWNCWQDSWMRHTKCWHHSWGIFHYIYIYI